MKKIFIKKRLEIDNNKNQKININESDIVFDNIESNEKYLKDAFNNSYDFVFYRFTAQDGTDVAVAYICTMVKKELLDVEIIKPFIVNMQDKKDTLSEKTIKQWIPAANIKDSGSLSTLIDKILTGYVVLFISNVHKAFIIEVKGYNERDVGTPDTEQVVRGPREGFVENIDTNLSLMRRKIRNPNLTFKRFEIGKQTRTQVYVCYIKGIANEDVLNDVLKRLADIDTDAILDSGYIEEYIEDYPLSPFDTITNSVKPDTIAAKILEGRIAILCDGSPHVLAVPRLFIENFHVSEDYYIRPLLATFLRCLRVFAFAISVFLPGIWVALQTYHQEMLPTNILITAASSREGIPFPASVECFLMIILFELLRESGIRLPKPIGQAIGIVGALILGETAVNAGIVGAVMVIVIGTTGVASFILPHMTEAILVYRFVFLFLGGFMGLLGISAGIFIVTTQICSLTSFGIPYIATIAHANKESLMKDFIFRFPINKMKYRPYPLSKNRVRQKKNSR